MQAGHEMVGRVVFIGGDWTRAGRFLKHNQCDGVLFRYVTHGRSGIVRITSIVE